MSPCWNHLDYGIILMGFFFFSTLSYNSPSLLLASLEIFQVRQIAPLFWCVWPIKDKPIWGYHFESMFGWTYLKTEWLKCNVYLYLWLDKHAPCSLSSWKLENPTIGHFNGCLVPCVESHNKSHIIVTSKIR